jgi:hypothetical protein
MTAFFYENFSQDNFCYNNFYYYNFCYNNFSNYSHKIFFFKFLLVPFSTYKGSNLGGVSPILYNNRLLVPENGKF